MCVLYSNSYLSNIGELIMKLILSMTLTFILFTTTFSYAQQDKKKPRQFSNAELRELANPGPEHKVLANYVGNWSVAIRFGSGTSALVYNGTSAHQMVADGRFLVCEFKATSNRGAAEGMFTLGFDRRHTEHTIQAIDSWGTYFVTARGKPQAGSKRVKLYGKDNDPHMKSLGLTKEFAYTIDFKDNHKFVIEVLMIDTRTKERREQKMMEYQFIRKK